MNKKTKPVNVMLAGFFLPLKIGSKKTGQQAICAINPINGIVPKNIIWHTSNKKNKGNKK